MKFEKIHRLNLSLILRQDKPDQDKINEIIEYLEYAINNDGLGLKEG